jgi:hypothetical protein
MFIWTGWDYIGETNSLTMARRHFLLRPSSNLAGFPKDSLFMYQSRVTHEHCASTLLPHWNWRQGDND